MYLLMVYYNIMYGIESGRTDVKDSHSPVLTSVIFVVRLALSFVDGMLVVK